MYITPCKRDVASAAGEAFQPLAHSPGCEVTVGWVGPQGLLPEVSICLWVGVETRVGLGRKSTVRNVSTQTAMVAQDTALHLSSHYDQQPLPGAARLNESPTND